MRILIISRGFKPSIGGTETYINELYDNLSKKHSIICITHFNPNRKKQKNIFQIISPSSSNRLVSFLHFIFNSVGIGVSKDFDIIHANTEVSGLSGIFIKLIKKKPLVTTIHDTGFIRFNPQWSRLGRAFRRILRMLVCKFSDKIVTVSPGVKNQLIRFLGVSGKNIEVIPYGIDTIKFNPSIKSNVRKIMNIKNKFMILFVGMLYPKKGLEYLIKSLYHLNKKFSKFKLFLVGTEIYPSYKKFLINLIDKYKLRDKIIFVGPVTYNEIPKWYKACDVFVLPSIDTEGLSLTCLEAGACGKPIIASTILEDTNAVLRDKTAIIVRPKNVEDLEKALFKLIKNRDLKEKIGLNGRKYSEKFSWIKTSKKTEILYTKLLGGKNQNS